METRLLDSAECVKFMKKFNVPLLVTGGGGYTKQNVARAWTYETAVLLDTQLPNELPVTDYYEYFRPDYLLKPPVNTLIVSCNHGREDGLSQPLSFSCVGYLRCCQSDLLMDESLREVVHELG
jgi:hypothetical protein